MISNCEVSGNTAGTAGGGIYNYSSVLALVATRICGNDPDQVVGAWSDGGGNLVSPDCVPSCPDINGDGIVGADDVLAVIADWGGVDSPADVTGDGLVGADDLLAILAAWGSC